MLVYIASPYTQGDTVENLNRQAMLAHAIMDQGHTPIVPTLNHYLSLKQVRPYEEWMRVCLDYVKSADVVLRAGGHSPGADREVAFAQGAGIPVTYSLHELYVHLGVESNDLPF
jgi:hypothetical protein